MTNLRMINNNVLIELPESQKEVELGGIVIPNFDMNKLRVAKIIDIGNKVQHYKIGMNVILAKGAGYEVDIQNKKFTVVKDTEIIGEKQ